MSMPVPRRFALPAIVVVGLAVLITALLAIGRVRVVKVGQTVRFDDFYYTIREVKRSTPVALSGTSSSPGQVEYTVTLTIDNRAKRVPYRFEHNWLILWDVHAPTRFYRVASDRCRAHSGATGSKYVDPLILNAGESATQDYVFVVPADVVTPRVKLMSGGRLGETLDRLLGEYTEFQLQ
jgi:hypothetical protein